MKPTALIQQVMTPMPHTIGRDISIKRALTMMREFRIRHLPVMEGGKLVGLVSDRDLKLVSSFKDAEDLPVEEAMTADPYTVEPEVSIAQVAREMAENRYGSAIIQQASGKVVGIFTATDSLRLLSEELDRRLAATGATLQDREL